jgi:hypothetical protein
MNKFFFHDIRGKDGTVTRKGIEVKDTYEAAKQAYHAYLGAYAYGHDENTDFVSCFITDSTGAVLMNETWTAPAAPEPAAE